MEKLIKKIREYISFKKKLNAKRLTIDEANVLISLKKLYKKKEYVYISNLRKECKLTPAESSRVIKKLENKEYITRELPFYTEDKRKVLIYLMPKGEKVISSLEGLLK